MDFLNFSDKPKMRNPTFVVCWEQDAGQLGAGVGTYLINSVAAEEFCKIDPVDFFPMNGVAITDNLVQFPESSFYAAPKKNLVIVYSTIPRYEYFRFLNLIADVASEHYRAKELYALGGVISMAGPSAERDFWGTFTTPQIKKSLEKYKISRELDFETPPGGRPTLNSFLLWAAKQREIPAVNLWVTIPFYMMGVNDVKGQRKLLGYLDERLKLELDYAEIDNVIKTQDATMARLRKEQTEIDRTFNKLESNLPITEQEHAALIKSVEEYLNNILS
jgi:proteasome assembly chaperone (PAC2) family protein